MHCEVLFSPAEFSALSHCELSGSTCVVFDVLRATTSMITALDNGADAIVPVREISEAVSLRQQHPDLLLAGERQGVRILAGQTGGVDFDFGNSPREFVSGRVRGRTIAMTTTNGTRALHACLGARTILAGSFLNLGSIVEWLRRENAADLIVVCAGTFEQTAYEDALAAGALCEALCNEAGCESSDSAQIARLIYRATGGDLASAMEYSKNARRLSANPELKDDVALALRRDTVNLVAALHEGILRRV